MHFSWNKSAITCLFLMPVILASQSVWSDDGGSSSCIRDVTNRLAELRRVRNERVAQVREREESVAKVRELLSEMKESDQGMRKLFVELLKVCGPNPTGGNLSEFASLARGLDSDNQADLKRIVQTKGWPTITVYGSEANQAAFLIVQHADSDIGFQKEMLAVLEKLWPRGETGGEGYALLFDRVRHAQDLPQRYGSQGRCVEGAWIPYDIEDPATVDLERRAVGLGTLAEYREAIKISHLCGG